MAAATTIGSPWERLGTQSSVTGSSTPVEPPDAAKQADVQEFLRIARERFESARLNEDKRRGDMFTATKFKLGEQWDPAIKAQREALGRPCLTINRLPGFLKHVTNAMRQARPEIKVDPVGDGADEEIAEIRQGLIRHILTNSQFHVVADTSFEQMTTGGLGWMRVTDRWEKGSVRNKELFIEWVPNPFSVYSDPGARRPDWADAKWRFIVEDFEFKEFQSKFGKNRIACGLDSFRSIGDMAPSWMINGKIRVAEYFHIEEEDDVLCEFADGSTKLYSEIDDAKMLEYVVADRPEKVQTVVWTLMTGVEILEERRWRGEFIPVIPVIGNQTELDGERILVGMVSPAIEAQRMFNYMYSCFVEACALAPKAPFIAEIGQLEGLEDLWKKANSDITAFLAYRAKSVDGQLVPPPQRQQAEPPVAAFVQGLKLADQNLKATFSIYDAALGERGPQESGLAINSRKIESDLATYDWIDNFVRALTLLGLILNDLLQHYYNEKGRIINIIREDLSNKAVPIGVSHQVAGKDTIYDLSKGKFSITIGTGPSFNTRRQEAAASMLEMAKNYPSLMQLAGAEIVEAMDWPKKEVIADILDRARPAEFRRKDPNKEQAPDPQEQQQKLDQLQGLVQQLSEALHKATDENAQVMLKEQFATMRTQITSETNLAIADLKTGLATATYMNDRIFAQLERINSALEPKLLKGESPTSSAAPASAAPAAPAQPQVPVSPWETPGAVGSAEPTQ